MPTHPSITIMSSKPASRASSTKKKAASEAEPQVPEHSLAASSAASVTKEEQGAVSSEQQLRIAALEHELQAMKVAAAAAAQEKVMRELVEARVQQATAALYVGRSGGAAPMLMGDGNYHPWSKAMQAHLMDMGLWMVVHEGLPEHKSTRSVIAAANRGAADAKDRYDVVSVVDGLAEEMNEYGGAAAASSSSSSSSARGPSSKDEGMAIKAYSLLLQAISKCAEASAIVNDVPFGNAHEVWMRLKKHYEGSSLLNKSLLLTEFEALRMNRGESCAMYSARLKELVMKLGAIGHTVEPDIMNHRLIHGLESPRFDMAKEFLRAFNAVTSWPFEQTCNYLRTQEAQLASEKKIKAVNASFSGDIYSESARNETRANFKDKVKCFKCQQFGHIKKECPSKTSKQGSNSKRCAHCANWGHEISQCRIKKAADDYARERASSSTDHSASPVTNTSRSTEVGKDAASLGVEVIANGGIKHANTVGLLTDGSPVKPKDEEASGQVVQSLSVGSTRQTFEWHLDSGAACHNAPLDTPLKNTSVNEEVRIRVASGQLLAKPIQGDLRMETPLADRPLVLKNVLTHAEMKAHLMSVSMICKSPGIRGVWFTDGGAEVITGTGDVLLKARQVDGVYVVDQCDYVEAPRTTVAEVAYRKPMSDEEKVVLLHERLGHLGISGMVRLASVDAVDGLDDVKDLLRRGHVPMPAVCKGCVQGKSHRAPLGTGTPPEWSKAAVPMDRANADSFGPFPQSMSGERYFLLVSDEASDKTWIAATKHKSDQAEVILAWHKRVVTEQGRPLKEFHTDGGGEFRSTELLEYWKGNGVKVTITMPHTPEQNSRAERKGRTIIEMLKAILYHAHAPIELWVEAAKFAVYIRNLCGVQDGHTKTPNQRWQPTTDPVALREKVKNLRVPFCDAWVHVPKEDRTKIEAKARPCIFIGYAEDALGYRFLDVEAGTIVKSRDATFDENSFKQCDLLRRGLLTVNDRSSGVAMDAKSYDEYLDEVFFQGSVRLGEILSAEEPQPDSTESGVPRVNEPAVSGAPSKKTVRWKEDNEFFEDEASESWFDDADSAYKPSSADNELGVRDHPVRDRQPTKFYGMVDLRDVAAEAVEMVKADRQALGAGLELLKDPTSLAEMRAAPDCDKFEKAIEEEFASIIEKEVMVEVEPEDVPRGNKPMPTKLVLKRKLGVNGEVSRHKARMVVQGFHQEPHKHFDPENLYAPTLHATSLRVLLSIATQLKYKLRQIDVKTAFLNAPVKEEIYITLPKGSKNALRPDGRPRVFRLKKALYGLKQAPVDWNVEYDGTLVNECGFTRIVSDTCVYVKLSRTGRPIYAVVFVDDTVFFHHLEDSAEVEEILGIIKKKYDVSDGGECNFLLGMRLSRKGDSLTIDQESYINRVLEKYGMLHAPAVSTPEEGGMQLTSFGCVSSHAHESADSESRSRQVTSDDLDEKGRAEYMSAVGALLYAAVWTRPDIAHAVGELTRFMSKPKQAHWKAAIRVMRYLKGCPQLGLTFRVGSKDTVELGPVFADANYAGDPETRRSTTGVIVKVNGNTVAWQSRRQKSVTLSSTEAEYMALGDATKEVMWLRTMLKELGWKQTRPTKIFGDNQASIVTAKNDTHRGRMKHIDVRHHFIREQLKQEVIELQWIATQLQQADLLTKGLGKNIFFNLRPEVVSC
ncbi:MAG: reverse transcriptase domain-containing protein [Candidatus Pacebacteria bacterium]|nr:reverse transcriptase domain-containing protein [Candidatus Paceibacterota bacterium]